MSFNSEQIKNAFKDFESKIRNIQSLSKDEMNDFLDKASEFKETELKKVEGKIKKLKNSLEKDISKKSSKIENKLKDLKGSLEKDWSHQSSKIMDEAKLASNKAHDLFKDYKNKVEKVLNSIK